MMSQFPPVLRRFPPAWLVYSGYVALFLSIVVLYFTCYWAYHR